MGQLEEEADIDLQSITIDLQHLFNFTKEEFNQIISQNSKVKSDFLKFINNLFFIRRSLILSSVRPIQNVLRDNLSKILSYLLVS